MDELLKENRTAIDVINARMLWGVSLVATIVFAVFAVCSLLISSANTAYLLYLIVACVSLICFLLCQFYFLTHPDYALLPIYVYFFCLFVVSIYMRVFDLPLGSMVLYTCLVLILPMVIIDNPVRIDVGMIIGTAIFGVFAFTHITKTYTIDVATSDLINAIIVLIVGIVVGRYMCDNRLQAIDAKRMSTYRLTTDTQTKLPNRRSFFQKVGPVEKVEGGDKTIAGVIRLDIDFFKEFSECYGRQKGDECLSRLGACFSDFGFRNDLQLYRYGGEKFIGIVSEGDYDAVAKKAESLLAAIRELDIPYKAAVAEKITASIGYASMDTCDPHTVDDLIGMADRAVFQAQTDGHDQAVGYMACKDLPVPDGFTVSVRHANR